ncbi:Ig-like domain-containing protein [Sphingomonas sp. Leaf21]|uniref:Ig-like domain-containing protein n=1 Tax=Sphingomonas sp. Leaf21 TaxID=2876550 RepID=UPI003FA6C90A
MRRRLLYIPCFTAGLLGMSPSSNASETKSYSYDALGRLVGVAVSGGPNNSVGSVICLDGAGNRTRYATGIGIAACTGGSSSTPTPTPSGNRPPVATTDNITLNCNSGGGFNILSNDSDPDGDSISLTSVRSNGGFSISVGNSAQGIAVISAGSTAGTFTGNYTVTDSRGLASSGSINVVINHGGPGRC